MLPPPATRTATGYRVYGPIHLQSALAYRALAASVGPTDCLNIVLAARYCTAALFTLDHRHYRATVPLNGLDAFVLLPADRDRWLEQTNQG